jgi:alpha-mannosidase
MIRILFFVSVLIVPFMGSSGQDTLKHLYLGNDTHTDLMWNGNEEDWYRYNLDMARFYLKIGEDTRDKPPEARSKWNFDVAWTLYMLEKRGPEGLFGRIIDQVKSGQISIPFNFTLPVYGASTAESVLRSFYYGGYLERKYGIDIDLAVCQENATIPLGLASLWAGSGARYSWKGVCNCATKTNTVGKRDHEIYWYTGLDGNRILMKWYSSYGWNADLGGYAEMLEPTVAVQKMEKLCDSEGYPYKIAGAFGKGWDNIHNYSYDLVWGLAHRTLPGTKLYLSNQVDFFRHFEREYGNKLPEVSLSYGNEWDINLASLAETSGKIKRSMEKLRTAEALASVAFEGDTMMLAGLERKKEDFLYGIGVYNLHGWTADGPIDRHVFAEYMRDQQEKVTGYVDTLFSVSIDHLGKRINSGRTGDVAYVFNPLNWARDGFVEIPAGKDFNSVKDLESGKIYKGRIRNEDGKRILRVWVEDIPSVGYKLFKLEAGMSGAEESVFIFSGNRLETPFYRVKISRSGAVYSLYDKRLKKEWTNGLLNDLGSKDHKTGANIRILEKDNFHIRILCSSKDPVKHESIITFYANDPRIDFQNTIHQNFDGLLHWSFAFNIENPEVWHEEVGAIIKAKTASAGGHYAERMARYDYLSLNHFLDIGNSNESITMSNSDCLFFRLGKSTPAFLDQNSSVVHILAGGQVNENLGMIRQDGDTLFHQSFSIVPHNHRFNAGESMRFALEHQNPLVAAMTGSTGDLTQNIYSYLTNDNKDLILWTLKPGEDTGLTMRFWNMGDSSLSSDIRLHPSILKAMHSSHVETDIIEIPVKENVITIDLNKKQLKTYRVITSNE